MRTTKYYVHVELRLYNFFFYKIFDAHKTQMAHCKIERRTRFKVLVKYDDTSSYQMNFFFSAYHIIRCGIRIQNVEYIKTAQNDETIKPECYMGRYLGKI